MSSFQDTSSSPVDIDDNAFYEELTRQILMLTDEDDHDDKVTYTNNGAMDIWRKPMVYGGVGPRPVAGNYYSWSETGKSSVPSWMENLWANGGGGTGVFIPNAVTTRGHGKRSARRRYNNNKKVTKNNDRGRVVYSAVGQKIHG